MHRRILLRSPKGPFEVASPETTLSRNLIGGNTGNLLFQHAAYKLLSTSHAAVSLYKGRPDAADADWINERHDAYVLPLANAFRPKFLPHLMATTSLIRRLRIPVVVLGVGAQSRLGETVDPRDPINAPVKAFISAVLDRSPTVGVRGEYSYDYLHMLGFRDIDIIGCPSMFLHGDQLLVRHRSDRLDDSASIALSLSPDVPGLAMVIDDNLCRYPNLVYVAQDLDTLALLLLGRTRKLKDSPDFPLSLDHPLFAQNRVRMFVDPGTWIDFLADCDFAFGTRIHGVIAALLAGTPVHLLAHDSRTLELARYFEIPHTVLRGAWTAPAASDLYESSDFRPMIAGHAARFQAFTAFLDRHQLGHVYREGETPSDYDAQIQGTPYPPPVTVAQATTPGSQQIRRLRHTPRVVGRRVRRFLRPAAAHFPLRSRGR